MDGTYYIYLIRNEINGKSYVGQTGRTILHRWREHLGTVKNKLNKMGNYLYHSMSEYGSDNFEVSELAVAVGKDWADFHEKMWILLLDSTNKEKGYNLTVGGRVPLATAETRAKLSAALKGKPAPNKGMKASDEARANMSRARREGNWSITPEGRESIRQNKLGEKNPNFGGKSVTEETRRKMSESRKGMSAWNLGISTPEDVKQKMRIRRPGIQADNHYLFRKDITVDSVLSALEKVNYRFKEAATLLGCGLEVLRNRISSHSGLREKVTDLRANTAQLRSKFSTEEMHSLLSEGMCCEAVGRALGCSGATVRNRIGKSNA